MIGKYQERKISSTRLSNSVDWEKMRMNYGGREMRKAHTK